MNQTLRRASALLISLTVVFAGCNGISALQAPAETTAPAPDVPNDEPAPQKTAGVGDDVPVSRALAAKMLAAAFNDLTDIDAMDREIPFTDVPASAWYDKYVNAAFTGGLMQGADGKFMPETPVTLSQAQILLDAANPDNKVKLQMTDENRDKPISYALWADLYKKFLLGVSDGKSIKDTLGVEERVFVVLATPDNNSQLSEWNMITDKGPLTFTGLAMSAYIDKEIRALQKDGDVLAVLAVESETPTIRNAYVVKADAGSVTVFSGGAERTYTYAGGGMQDAAGKICDINLSGGAATSVSLFDERAAGVVKRTTLSEIELEGRILPVSENFKVYGTAEVAVKWKALKDIIVGQELGHFVVRDGQAAAAVIAKRASGDNIRVAISTNGFAGLVHGQVSVTCDGPFTLTAGGNASSYDPGYTLNISKELFAGANRVTLAAADPDGKLRVTSIKRAWEGEASPAYRGVLEVSTTEGGYHVVNELDMEQYLYAVVPSEMPSSYGVETSKAQAVTARSYAKNQLFANRFHACGANVDDSVSCQVYNNIPENETSVAAVNATKGLCLTYGGVPVSANFFSTSSGMTANGGEVWADSATWRFPADTQPYLTATRQHDSADYGDLRVEENAAAFFKDTDAPGYDSAFPWFRWRVTMDAAEIAASVNATIKGRYDVNPKLIKTLQPGGAFRSRPIESIGGLVNLEVRSRGEGGNIMEMLVTGTEATVLIITEYNVRALIKPVQQISGRGPIITTKKDGSTSENYTIMPSAFYTMDKTYNDDGRLASVTFYGGGNGHGAGMSQNGAKGMIDAGHSYEDVLRHFFPGAEIEAL